MSITPNRKPLSEATKAKISMKLMGHSVSEKTKQAVSKATRLRLSNPENHPMYGKHHSEESLEKLSFAGKERNLIGENNPFYGKKHTEETISRISAKRTGVSLNKGCVVTQEHRDKISSTLKKRWNNDVKFKLRGLESIRNASEKRLNHRGINKPETELLNLLNELFPDEYKFVGDGKFWIEQLNPDFINCNGQKKIVEMFGDYWHTLPAVVYKDKFRIKLYNKYGYQTLIVWQHELKNKEILKQKLLEFNHVHHS